MKKKENKYDFVSIEKSKLIKFNWIDNSFQTNKKEENILLPPPNITGEMHIGHTLNLVIQRYLVIKKFINGIPCKIIPGIDHAGIATQSKVESDQQKKSLSIKEKIDYVWNILLPDQLNIFSDQWSQLGLIFNSNDINFTMDKNSLNKVNYAFNKLLNDGMVYQDYRIINWDYKLQTVVSDIETENKEVISKLYYIRYNIHDSKDYLIIATSRPETIFADVALFVNPKDDRYSKIIGSFVENPLNGKIMPILKSDIVEINFGSGVLKCSPGHDQKDYDLAKENNLEIISCCDEKGILNELAGNLKGLPISQVRDEVLKLLGKSLIEVKEYRTSIKISQRSGVIIEPIISNQWFLNIKSMVSKIKNNNPNFLDEISFFPIEYKEKVLNFIENIKEWCISRQLWWGHKIPLDQTSDVFDTWFSSSLWPMIAGNEEEIEEFKVFDSLVTAYDIILFWVLKMIILTTYLSGKVPFKKVFIHGIIRDKFGRKMSKSIGNGINQNEIIKEYGVDALSSFFLANNNWGKDTSLDIKKIEGCSHFIQKLWSIKNYLLENITLGKISYKNLTFSENVSFLKIERWLLFEYLTLRNDLLINDLNTKKCYELMKDFVKNFLSIKYIPLTKVLIINNYQIINYVFQQLIILFYPYMPFVCEKIFWEITGEHIEFSGLEDINDSNIRLNDDFVEIKFFISVFNSLEIKSLTVHRKKIILIDKYKDSFDENFLNWLLFSHKINLNLVDELDVKNNLIFPFSLFPVGFILLELPINDENLKKTRSKEFYYFSELERCKNFFKPSSNFYSKASEEEKTNESLKFEFYKIICEIIKSDKKNKGIN